MTNRILNFSDEVIRRYVSNKETVQRIANTLTLNVKTVRRILKRNNVSIRGSKKNLIGQPFGRLSVIRYVGNDKSQKCQWECRCKCGNTSIIRGSDLLSGKVNSCGCLLVETSRENIKKSHGKYPKSFGFKGIGELSGRYLSIVKNRAYVSHREYSVSKEFLWELFLKQNKKCSLSGLEIHFGNDNELQTASLDRIDSSGGYTPNNVQWLHKDINNMKQHYNESDFINYCNLIVKNHEKKIYS